MAVNERLCPHPWLYMLNSTKTAKWGPWLARRVRAMLLSEVKVSRGVRICHVRDKKGALFNILVPTQVR